MADETKPRVQITLRADGFGTIEIDGQDISRAVTGLTVVAEPGKATRAFITCTDVRMNAESTEAIASIMSLANGGDVEHVA